MDTTGEIVNLDDMDIDETIADEIPLRVQSVAGGSIIEKPQVFSSDGR